MADAPKKTVMNDWHRANGAKMVPFGGWDMPVNYSGGIIAEHLATRKHAGLFDISHMGRLRITGEDALPFLQHTLTNDSSQLKPGTAQYTIIPDESGGAVDDAYLYQRAEGDYLLVVNASNAQKDVSWLSGYLKDFPRAQMEDITEELFMASLQGPESPAVLRGLFADVPPADFEGLLDPPRNSFNEVTVRGHPITISRTGYTGEPFSFELFAPANFAIEMWERLLKAGRSLGISPVGLGARDSLRLEAGYPLYGHEFGVGPDGQPIPIFAVSLSRFAVSFEEAKGRFVGREALKAHSDELNARRAGELDPSPETWSLPKRIFHVRVIGKGIARQGHEVSLPKGEDAGHITSGTMVPCWKFDGDHPGEASDKRAIALAYLRADLGAGQSLLINDGRRMMEAVIVKRHMKGREPPFVRPEMG